MYELINRLLPRNLAEHEDYQVLVKLFSLVAEDIQGFIDEFPSLVDVETCADIFLPKLSYLVNHELKTNIPYEYQRIVLSRIIQSYKNRGSLDSIKQAATWGDEDTWVADHIFYPGERPDNYPAEITNPISSLFVHSKSKFSGSDKFSDSSFYRDGTLQIALTNLNDRVRRAIKRVVPAGIKIFFILLPAGTSNILEDFGDWHYVKFSSHELNMDMTFENKKESLASFSEKPREQGKLSGRQVIYAFYEVNSSLSALSLPYSKIIEGRDGLEINYSIYSNDDKGPYDDLSLDYAPPKSDLFIDLNKFTSDIELIKTYSGLPKRSTSSAIRSGKYAMSGSCTGIIDGFASFDAKPIAISPLYPVANASHLKIGDVGFDNTDIVEVIIVSTNS